MGLTKSPTTEATLRTQEDQLDIVYDKRDGKSYRKIARETGCTPRTAKKYGEHPELIGKPREPVHRASKVDPYRAHIAAYLDDDPEYQATVIYDKLVRQGYSGGYGTVKLAVRPLREQAQAKAYVRFETEPGAQAQADFGEFQVELPDGSTRKYYLFAMVLGYSRMLYAELLDRCDMVSFLEAHQRAFAAFGGTPSEVLYDRMRNVYLRQLAGKVEFTQALMDLATHWGFRPQAAPAYAPWVKGKIERPIGFVRESFWRGYQFTDLATANRDLAEWLREKSERVHGTTHERVDVRYARELPYLQPLAPQPCDVSERLYREVRKDCTIAVCGNRYVVAHLLVGQKVVVRVRHGRIRVFNGAELVVTYDIPEGKGRLVQAPRFYEALRADREMQARKFASGRKHKGRATISPSKPVYPIDVQCRSLDAYIPLGGEVRYA
jgi:transposase